MILDALSYKGLVTRKNLSTAVVRALVSFIETRLGVHVVYDARRLSIDKPELLEPLAIAELLLENKIISSVARIDNVPDEPPIKLWLCGYADPSRGPSGGASLHDEKAALYSALAEGLERQLFYEGTEHFSCSVTATEKQIAQKGIYIAPERFVGFSVEQRRNNPKFFLSEDAAYLWVRAESLITRKKVYIPAQLVVATSHPSLQKSLAEPFIRQGITTGMATWPTKRGAQLAGVLELIERDAFMLMWLNQMTLPRIQLSSFVDIDSTLAANLEKCLRYRLQPHIISMVTDAPTHAICIVLEDMTGSSPRYVLGLKAHSSMPRAVEGALNEALRARRSYRSFFEGGGAWKSLPTDAIGHKERIFYWGEPEHARGLNFLIQGDELRYEFDAPWEQDDANEHLERVLSWCRQNSLECLSVSMGTPATNPAHWYVEKIVMPDLQPIHLHEQWRHLAGKRLKEIPKMFGYTPLEHPFIDAPHPFF